MHVADLMGKFQLANTARVTEIVQEFLPRGFRGGMVAVPEQAQRSGCKSEMEKLLQGGGAVADKYQLLWGHQLKRRETLASIGNASGLWKALVEFIAGVPSSLLNFVKTINDPEGPGEGDARLKFAPNLYVVRKALNEVHIAMCIALADPSTADALLPAIIPTCNALPVAVASYLKYLEQVMFTAPFFVTASQLSAQSAGGDGGDGSADHRGRRARRSTRSLISTPTPSYLGNPLLPTGKTFLLVYLRATKLFVPITRHDSHRAAVKGRVGPAFESELTVILRWDNTYSLSQRQGSRVFHQLSRPHGL